MSRFLKKQTQPTMTKKTPIPKQGKNPMKQGNLLNWLWGNESRGNLLNRVCGWKDGNLQLGSEN